MIVRVEVALLHPRVKERGCCLESPALQPFCAFSLVSFLPTSQGTESRNKPRAPQKFPKILEPPQPNPTPVAKSRMLESLRNAGSPQFP